MAYILTNEVSCSYQNHRIATPYDTREEAITAGQEAIATEVQDGDAIQEDYGEQGNELAEDQVDFRETSSFLFEGFSSKVEICIVEVEDDKVDAFVKGFEK